MRSGIGEAILHDGEARQEREHAQDNRSGLIIHLSQHVDVGLWELAQQANHCTDPLEEQTGPMRREMSVEFVMLPSALWRRFQS